MPKRKLRPPPRPPEPEEPDDIAGLDDDENPALPWEDELDDWQQQERIDDSNLEMVLYRLKGQKMKERVWKWDNEIPDEHEIGLKFGGGEYMIYAILKGPPGFRKVKHRRFSLAASYDAERIRAQQEQGMSLAGAAGGSIPAASPFEMMITLMKEVIVPMLNRPAPASGPQGFEHWNQANLIVGRVVEEAARSQIRMSREVGGMSGRNGAEEEEGGEEEFKDFLKGMIMEYGPSLIEATGMKLKSMAGVVKRDEVFQTLAGNPTLFGKVVQLLSKDPELPAGMAEKVLSKLKGIGVALPLPPGAFQTVPTSGAVNPG